MNYYMLAEKEIINLVCDVHGHQSSIACCERKYIILMDRHSLFTTEMLISCYSKER